MYLMTRMSKKDYIMKRKKGKKKQSLEQKRRK
jgi:hypothetical protein